MMSSELVLETQRQNQLLDPIPYFSDPFQCRDGVSSTSVFPRSLHNSAAGPRFLSAALVTDWHAWRAIAKTIEAEHGPDGDDALFRLPSLVARRGLLGGTVLLSIYGSFSKSRGIRHLLPLEHSPGMRGGLPLWIEEFLLFTCTGHKLCG